MTTMSAETTKRALLLENIDAGAVDLLESEGWKVEHETRALGEDELIDRLDGIHVLGIRSKTEATARVLQQAPDLVALGAFCIGTNQIDLSAASQQGVAVFNAPFSNTRSVVELVLAEIISLYRRLGDKSHKMHQGVWDKSAVGSHEVRGRRLGIIGYGKIGSQLSVLAEALGLQVRFYDILDRLALGNARQCGSLEELLAESDIVTLHVDGRPGNSGMFGEREFALMPQGSMFLNLSRGFVVDHAALREHLESGHLAGAAIDVFPEEPAGRGDEFRSELRGMPNVILTPHVGGSTEEAQTDIGQFVAGKLRDFCSEGSTALSVNLPELLLARRDGTHRMAHLHRNVPGVLAKVNGILGDHGVNVEGQLLGTRGELGYVLTDIVADYAPELVRNLQDLPETVRLHVLH
ncbi:MAG TPA: phosphoglycerate dehydrogenase [Segeticoccus sp.]|uniref:phosphoglycerate dehydrogenase n=1 Tax=Segeticoccus sp. TaxID=2706531 RepID=UPI002D7F26D2|nr:phosphoglycerate dehydrogenase [Segeticoccus sp.]HET8601503.1 phosphoglycerate dehydrogenase [Segeticoccus sp.]